MLQNAKTPRPVCDHAQNRELFDSVEQRFGKIIANGLGSLCRIIGLYRELRHLAGEAHPPVLGRVLRPDLRMHQVSGDPLGIGIYINWSDSIVTCNFHCYLILQAYNTGT